MKTNTSILVWAIIAAGLLFIFSAYQNNNVVEVPYSDFRSGIGNVTSLQLLDDGRTFRFTVEENDRVYRSVFPPGSAESTIDKLLDDGKNVNVNPPPKSSIWTTMLIAVVPVLLLIGAIVWVYKKSVSGGGAIGAFGKSTARLVDPQTNDVTLADVAGNPGDFDDIYEMIDFLKNPEKYQDASAKMPHGVLMYGPPGVGKTLLARAIAGEASVPFYTISGSDFVEMFVGVGASRVRDMFDNLRKAQPAILFIDEIDALGAERSAGKQGAGHREADQTLNQLLSEMDGFNDTDDNIIVIAATNRPDALDPALLRPGRFDRKIPLGLPDINAREKILEVQAKTRKLSKDVDLRIIAKGTPGMSGADLANLVNEAAMITGKDSRKKLTMADFEAARDKVFMGREKSLAMGPEEKEMTAYHEAGHAIAAYFSEDHDPIYKITIIPRDRALGVTMYLPEDDKYSTSKKKLESQLLSLMGGRAAEEVQYGTENISTGASNDLEKATSIARNMITRWGFGEDTGLTNYDLSADQAYFLLSDSTKERIDQAVSSLLDRSYKEATRILNENKEALDRVAASLVEKETIDLEEFKQLMDGGQNE